MSKEDLLKIENREVFEEELLNISEDYETDINKWDKELIEHYLKIADMDFETFKHSFDEHYCPIDYEDEME